MNDKELADKVADILGAKHCQGPFSDNWYFPDHGIEQYLGFSDEMLVRDWRVAGALMEKCIYIDISLGATEDGDEWGARAAATSIDSFEENYSYGDCNPMSRAIIEACVEALSC